MGIFGGEEVVTIDDLVEREGIYYKKFTDVPFSGKVTGIEQGTFKNGKKEGPWVDYWSSGRLREKGDYKNGNNDGPWVVYDADGTVIKKLTRTYKNEKKGGIADFLGEAFSGLIVDISVADFFEISKKSGFFFCGFLAGREFCLRFFLRIFGREAAESFFCVFFFRISDFTKILNLSHKVKTPQNHF